METTSLCGLPNMVNFESKKSKNGKRTALNFATSREFSKHSVAFLVFLFPLDFHFLRVLRKIRSFASSLERSTSPCMEEAKATILSYIETSTPSDASLALSLQEVSEEAFCAIFAVGSLAQEPLITFQIFFDQLWNPLVRLVRFVSAPLAPSQTRYAHRFLANFPSSLSFALFLLAHSLNDPLFPLQFVMSDSPKLESWVTVIGRALEASPETQILSGLLPRISRTLEDHLAPPVRNTSLFTC